MGKAKAANAKVYMTFRGINGLNLQQDRFYSIEVKYADQKASSDVAQVRIATAEEIDEDRTAPISLFFDNPNETEESLKRRTAALLKLDHAGVEVQHASTHALVTFEMHLEHKLHKLTHSRKIAIGIWSHGDGKQPRVLKEEFEANIAGAVCLDTTEDARVVARIRNRKSTDIVAPFLVFTVRAEPWEECTVSPAQNEEAEEVDLSLRPDHNAVLFATVI